MGRTRRRSRPLAKPDHLELGRRRGRTCGAHTVGLQFGAKWTAGSGFTENGLIVDGRLSKLGDALDWTYDWDNPMAPWRVVDPGGQLDVTLTTRDDKRPARSSTAARRTRTRSSARGPVNCQHRRRPGAGVRRPPRFRRRDPSGLVTDRPPSRPRRGAAVRFERANQRRNVRP